MEELITLRSQVQEWLRSKLWYIQGREIHREGFKNAWMRRRIQRRILCTPPVDTDRTGNCEVRVLTWRRDWVNCLWALKTFYAHSPQPFALYIHDGGLLNWQITELRKHFPSSFFVGSAKADEQTVEALKSRGHSLSVAYRRTNISTRKLFDFYLLSKAERIISIDSDIVFFKQPNELISPSTSSPTNAYNRDCMDWYSISCDEIQQVFGLTVPARVNSGLNTVWRESIRFDLIDQWLAYPPLFDNRWVTEQTIHAMCSAIFGLSFLPETYMVGTSPGLLPDAICKHYPSDPRLWLYREGMPIAWNELSNKTSPHFPNTRRDTGNA